MNETTNYSYHEASAKRKKRNQFISILIIVAVVMAVVVGWGIREFKKSQDAERIKNALNSQVEPAFPMPSHSEGQAALVDSSAMEVSDVPEAKPGPTPEKTMDPPVVAQEPPPAPEPKVVAPVVETKPAEPEPKVVEKTPPPPAPTPATVTPSKPKTPNNIVVTVDDPKPITPPEPPPAKVEPKPVAKVDPAPVTPPPEPVVVAKVTPPPAIKPPAVIPASPSTSSPAKTFAPEDMPMPAKVEPSEEGLAQIASLPKAEPTADATPAVASEHFKTGLAAYRQADYVNAIRAFGALPKPASRKRGDAERDEYVQGNFLRGVSLLKMQHISEAASAFQNTLEYEKYYPLANMNLGICYIELKQYAKAHKSFEAVIRDQSFIEPAMFDEVMQRTKYFWALAWTRLYKGAKDPDKQNYYRQQAVLRWKDYQVWFGKNDKFKSENQKADNYLKSLAAL